MKLKKLNVTIRGYELYVEVNAPTELIRQELKKKERAVLPKEFNDVFSKFKK